MLYREGTDYYRTPRASHPNSVNWYMARSLDKLATYSSFAFVDMIAPHPLLMIAGSEADTLYFSQEAIAAAKEPKELFIVEGKTHIDLYDDTTKTVPKLVELMAKNLAGVRVCFRTTENWRSTFSLYYTQCLLYEIVFFVLSLFQYGEFLGPRRRDGLSDLS